MRAYAKFRKKTDIWKLQMESYASKKDQALLLYAGLTGELEQELEHLDMSQIHKDDGVEVIMELLKKPFEQRLTNQKRRFLHEFETFRCQGETMRGYVQRFRRVQRSLTAVGVNISGTFDADSLGSRLFDRSGLSHQDQRRVLCRTSWSFSRSACRAPGWGSATNVENQVVANEVHHQRKRNARVRRHESHRGDCTVGLFNSRAHPSRWCTFRVSCCMACNSH